MQRAEFPWDFAFPSTELTLSISLTLILSLWSLFACIVWRGNGAHNRKQQLTQQQLIFRNLTELQRTCSGTDLIQNKIHFHSSCDLIWPLAGVLFSFTGLVVQHFKSFFLEGLVSWRDSGFGCRWWELISGELILSTTSRKTTALLE